MSGLIINPHRFGGFQPSSLNPLAWHDGSDSSLKLNGAGNPVTAENELVKTLVDKTGNGHDFAQATTSSQAKNKLSIQNGLGGLQSDGIDDFMSTPRLYSDDIYDIYMVAKVVSAQYKAVLAQNRGLADVGRVYFMSTGGAAPADYDKARVFFNNGSSHFAITTSTYTDAWVLLRSKSDGTGNTALRINNGGDEAVITGETWTPFDTPTTLFGIDGSSGVNAQVELGEAICFDRVLSEAEALNLTTWLNNKWAYV